MAKKKIYDIMPPHEANKVESTVKGLAAGKKIKENRHWTVEEPVMKKKPFPLKKVFAGGVVVFLLLVGYGYVALQRAEVEVWPVMETVSMREKIAFDVSLTGIDIDDNRIPAHYLEIEKEGSEQFEATGIATDEGYASGKITIYNSATPVQPLILISGTHFLSDSGKYFVTTERITVPAARYQDGKLVPGSIETTIVAKDPGSDYNIGPSKFSVPRLAGTAYYYTTHGESKSAMRGGHSGQVKQVTEEDIKRAKDSVVAGLLKQVEQSITDYRLAGNVIIDEAIKREITIIDSQAQPGSPLENFIQGAKVTVSTLAFKKGDIERLVKKKVTSQLPEEKTFLEGSFSIYYILDAVDLKEGTMTVDVEFSAKTYRSIETDVLLQSLLGKSEEEARIIINTLYLNDIARVEVDFWPFWTKKIPGSAKRVKVILNVGDIRPVAK